MLPHDRISLETGAPEVEDLWCPPQQRHQSGIHDFVSFSDCYVMTRLGVG